MAVIHKKECIHQAKARLPDISTVFQAELFAIKLAADFIIDANVQIRYCKIFCDSQSVIRALNATEIKDRMVQHTHQALEKASERVASLRIVWIKAHNGNTWNCLADDLAKEGTMLDDVTHPSIPIPISHIKSSLDLEIRLKWKSYWHKYPHARQSKIFIKESIPLKAKAMYNMGRFKLGTLARVITGHNALLYHRHNIDPENNSPLCRYCTEQEMETFSHLILDCPRFENFKRTIFTSLPFEPPEIWEPSQLLEFAEHPEIEPALNGFFDGVHYNETYS
jgi:ribonuclease HI